MKGGVAWHASPPSPDLGGDFETELGEPIARHPAMISDTSTEVRLVRAEQDLTYRRLDIIGPHQRVNTDACAALALGFDIIPVIDQRGDTVPDVKALRSHGARQRVQQVGAMQQVVRKPERGRHDSGDRGTKQDPAIVPAATWAGPGGIWSGWLTGILMLNMSTHEYVYGVHNYYHSAALIFSLVKGFFFGITITFIGCYAGLQAEGGAAGVGRTARNTVVAIIVALMVLDVVLAPLYKAVG